MIPSSKFCCLIVGIVGVSAAVAAQQRTNAPERRPLILDRAPARTIANPNPVFRAIVIDPDHGEVFMANDKESAGTSVLVYPTQFPSTNRIMEPSRRIAGPKTDLGMVCGLAVSVKNGELYSVSGETGTLNVYPLDATGNVGPARQLKGVDRKSTRLNSSHLGISYAVFCLKKKK